MSGELREARTVLDLLGEALVELRALSASSTELLSLTRGGQKNGVLWSGTAKPDASGSWRQSVQVPFQAVGFADPNKLGLTIATVDGAGASSTGPGIIQAGAGDSGCIPLVGYQLVVTPAAPGAFVVVIYAKPQPFAYSLAQ